MTGAGHPPFGRGGAGTLYLSLDPYMRGRMDDARSFAQPVRIGEVMTGQVVAEVVTSDVPGFAPGDKVLAGSGRQDYALSDGRDPLQGTRVEGLEAAPTALNDLLVGRNFGKVVVEVG